MDIFKILHFISIKKVTAVLKAGDWFILSRNNPLSPKPYESFAIKKEDFINEIIPLPKYLKYVATLTQSGIEAPVSSELENELSNVVISYVSPGVYNIFSDSFADLTKIFIIKDSLPGTLSVDFGGNITTGFVSASILSDIALGNYIQITGFINGNIAQDNLLSDFPIEIRVYK